MTLASPALQGPEQRGAPRCATILRRGLGRWERSEFPHRPRACMLWPNGWQQQPGFAALGACPKLEVVGSVAMQPQQHQTSMSLGLQQ